MILTLVMRIPAKKNVKKKEVLGMKKEMYATMKKNRSVYGKMKTELSIIGVMKISRMNYGSIVGQKKYGLTKNKNGVI